MRNPLKRHHKPQPTHPFVTHRELNAALYNVKRRWSEEDADIRELEAAVADLQARVAALEILVS